MAKFAPSFANDRKPLHTLLPLAAPLALYIEPSNYCNLKCNFCPQHFGLIKEKKIMPVDLLVKVCDDLAGFEKAVEMIHLYAFGEPLLNPEFANFIRIIKSRLRNTTKLVTSTNATRLSPKIAEEIVDAGLDKINIMIYGLSQEQYLKNCNAKINFNQIKENCMYLFSIKKNLNIHICGKASLFTEKEQGEFIELFGQHCDTIYLDNIVNIWPGIKVTNKSGNRYNFSGQTEEKICPSPFYQMVIHSSGKVSPCCVDYMEKLIMGDVVENNLVDIWNKDIWRNLRLNVLKNDKTVGICAICDFPEVGASVDIAPYRQELLQKYHI